MKKRGISAVVATILIILIVVVGVGIVWKVILPIFQELEFLSYSDVQLNIVRQGFTVYDPEQNFAFVQIERGGDEVNVTGVEIGFNFGGTTKTYQSKRVPTPNGKYTYKFNFTNDSDMGIPQNVTPDKVTVAPIFTINNKVRLGKILDSEDMPVGRIHMSAEEWEKANNESATAIVVTTGPGGGEEPGESVIPIEPEPPLPPVTCGAGEVEYGGGCAIPIDSCRTLDLEGETYVLNKSIVNNDLTGDCIIISADNIILDCQDYLISSEDSYSGVYSNQDYTLIKNCDVDMGSNNGGHGIELFESGHSIISNNHVYGNYRGIQIGGYTDSNDGNNDIVNNLIENNKQGLHIAYSNNNNVMNNNVSSNHYSGIIFSQSSGNMFNNNSIQDTGGSALYLGTNANNNLIYNTTIKDNSAGWAGSSSGIQIYEASNNLIWGGIIENTYGGYGINLYARGGSPSSNNVIKDIEIIDSFKEDFRIFNDFGGISINNSLVNVTYETESSDAPDTEFFRKWYYRARFVYKGDGLPLENLNITIDDEYYSSTDLEGWIPQHELTGYIKQGTSKQVVVHSIDHDSDFFNSPTDFGMSDNTIKTYELLFII